MFFVKIKSMKLDLSGIGIATMESQILFSAILAKRPNVGK
jgi:hypothetical protein